MTLVLNIPNSYIRVTTFKTNEQLKEDKQAELSGFAGLEQLVTGQASTNQLFIPLPGIVTTVTSESFGLQVLQYGAYSTKATQTNSTDKGEEEDTVTVNLAFSEGRDRATVEFLVAGQIANAAIKGAMLILNKVKTKAQRVKIDVVTVGGEIIWGYALENFSKSPQSGTDSAIYVLELAKWKFDFNQGKLFEVVPTTKESLTQ